MIEFNWRSYGNLSRFSDWAAVAQLEDRISASTFIGTVTWDAANECACNYTASYNYTQNQAWQTYYGQGMQMLGGLVSANASLDSSCDAALAGETDDCITVSGVIAAAQSVGDRTSQWQCAFADATGAIDRTGYASDATDPATTPGDAKYNARILVARNKVINSTLNRIDQYEEDVGIFLSGIVGMMQLNQTITLNTELGQNLSRLRDLKARFPGAVK